MSYTLNGTVEFIAPLFIREGGYWENHMLPYLEAEGWKVIVVDCAGVKTTLDFAYRLVEVLRVFMLFRMILTCAGLQKMLV